MSEDSKMSKAIHSRLHELTSSMKDHGLDAVLLNPGSSMPYLSGLHFHISERPVILSLARKGGASIVVPELERQKMSHCPYEVDVHTYSEDVHSWQKAFSNSLGALKASGATRVGIEPRSLRVLELRFIETALPGVELVSCEDLIASLRMRKDEEEVAQMLIAVDIAQNALLATLPSVKVGVTEKEMAALLIQHLLQFGSGGELPFQPIVAFGANSANPHAVPTDYAAREGDMILFDWGANTNGYFSDLTRTFALGDPGDVLRGAYMAVQAANAAGRAASKPGVTAGSVDAATRHEIEQLGLGEYFTHRTGHGLGLEVHEEPYIRAGNDAILDVGMTFTVEPGVYLNGKGGIRIEDDMLITKEGCESLSTLDRDLRILPV
jgi:Xaa-Pro dipeptidase